MSDSTYIDGDFFSARPTIHSRVTYPFQNFPIPDSFARVIERPHLVNKNYFSPAVSSRQSWTNYLINSEAPASWALQGASATNNNVLAPDGNTTMGKLQEDSSNGPHNINDAPAAPAAAAKLTVSIFVQAAERNYVKLSLYNSTDARINPTIFDLTIGVVVSGPGTIQAMGNSQYRLSVTGTPTVTNSFFLFEIGLSPSNFSYTGTAGYGVYVWGRQFVDGGDPGPYVSTTSVARTVSTPLYDISDPLAFLVSETDISTDNQSIVASFVRKYARIPNPKVQSGTAAFTKPSPDQAGGLIPLSKNVSYVSLTGSYTYFSDRFALKYICYLPIPGPWYIYQRRDVAVDDGSGTLPRTITVQGGHGLALTDIIIFQSFTPDSLKEGVLHIVNPGQFTLPDGNTIVVNAAAANFCNTTKIACGKFLRSYAPGGGVLRTRITERFYLPSYTPGAATIFDIVPYQPSITPADFISIAAQGGYMNYLSSDLKPWMGPILSQTLTEINTADVT